MEYRYRGKVQRITPEYAVRLLNDQKVLLVRRADGTRKVIWRGKHGGERHGFDKSRAIPCAEECAA